MMVMDDDSNHYDDDNDDVRYVVDCEHCAAQVLESNYPRQLENVHKCQHCANYLPIESIQRHIQRVHMKKCSYCQKKIFETKMQQHILTHTSNNNNDRPLLEAIGMIQLGKISDKSFNELINARRVYAKNGHLFIK